MAMMSERHEDMAPISRNRAKPSRMNKILTRMNKTLTQLEGIQQQAA